jgi:hypothetical protein
MRTGPTVEEIRVLLERVAPHVATGNTAARIHERVRRLAGHWKATPYGGDMVLVWPAGDPQQRVN